MSKERQHINRAALFHRAGLEYRFANSDGSVTIRLKTACNNVRKVTLIHGQRYDHQNPPAVIYIPMERQLSDGVSDWFEVSFTPQDPRLFYSFCLEGDTETLYLQESGISVEPVTENRNELFFFPYIQPSDVFDVPEWARGAVVYQIFPDRFERVPGYGVTTGHRLKKWSQSLGTRGFFGGNLEGIRRRIPYLKELGIDILYLTPIFSSKSYHRYDTDDYFDIDPLLGSKEDLRNLVNDLHAHGIRVMLDAVVNHCGPNFFAFVDVLNKGVASPYKDWFFVQSWPMEVEKRNYETFATCPTMPKLNMTNPDAAAYFCEMGKYWIREFDIDGWRIDVANEVDPFFWTQFRHAVKSVKTDALLVGEIWGDSFQWLQGNMFDAVMHYPFREPIRAHFAHGAISLHELDNRLNRVASLYTSACRDALWTILDSHDTERFLHAAKEQTLALELAAFLQFVFPGAPMVYYGTELGMSGGNDPDCRRPMRWDLATEDNSLLQHYKRLSEAKHHFSVLRTGNFRTWAIHNGAYVFLRESLSLTVMVILNTGDLPNELELPLPIAMQGAEEYKDYMENATVQLTAQGKLRVLIPAASGAIIY